MTKVLLIGSFFSHLTGAKSVSEKLKRDLSNQALSITLVSKIQNQYLRLLDICFSTAILRYHKIHIDTFSGPAFRIAEAASLIALIRGKQSILTLRGGALPEFYLSNRKRVKHVFTRSSKIQTPSLYLKDFFSKHGFQVNYLPNPINLERFPFKRYNVKPYSLLWVRAFTSIYNPDLAVKTLFEVKKNYPDATLTMVGPDKGLLPQTRVLINELGLNSAVNIVGPVKNDELFKFYQSHEVFLNTTSYESFGVAVVEAAACGIPVVSTKVGEIPYLWKHDENMLLVEGFDPKVLAKEVSSLFESKELRMQISKNARIKAESFDWEVIKEKWISLLTDLA